MSKTIGIEGRVITAALAAAQKLGLKVSTSAILGQDMVHKAGQRHLGAAFGSTEFSALKMVGSSAQGRATPFGCCSWLD